LRRLSTLLACGLPNCRRAFVPGGCWFFTANLLDRRSSLLTDQIETLREATRRARERHPFIRDAGSNSVKRGWRNKAVAPYDLHRMTHARVLTADMLFATLDPTLRAIELPKGLRIVLSGGQGRYGDLGTGAV
jgi:50S ribosomal subunit-associated GTPase HflX